MAPRRRASEDIRKIAKRFFASSVFSPASHPPFNANLWELYTDYYELIYIHSRAGLVGKNAERCSVDGDHATPPALTVTP